MKKYSLTSETKISCGIKLFRIKAECSFGNVSKGDLGGWIEKEINLSMSGNAWVYGNAEVSGDARVYGDAGVSDNARVSDNAEVSGNARVFGDARVSGDAEVFGKFKLQFGWCFARIRKNWDVTEIKNGDEILLIKDYKPAEDDKVKITIDGKEIEISRESAEALKKSLTK